MSIATIKEFRAETGMSLAEALAFLDRARIYGLTHYPDTFESTKFSEWETPKSSELAEQWAERNFEKGKYNHIVGEITLR